MSTSASCDALARCVNDKGSPRGAFFHGLADVQ